MEPAPPLDFANPTPLGNSVQRTKVRYLCASAPPRRSWSEPPARLQRTAATSRRSSSAPSAKSEAIQAASAAFSARPSAGPSSSRSAADERQDGGGAAGDLRLQVGGERLRQRRGPDQRSVSGGVGAVAICRDRRAARPRRARRRSSPARGRRRATGAAPRPSRAAARARRGGAASGGRGPPPPRGGRGGRAARGRRPGSTRARMPVAAIAATAGAGSAAARSLAISAPTRSRESRARPSWWAAQAARPSGSRPSRRVAVPGVDAEEAQDPQVVLGDPALRVADEADAPGAQVGQAAERVDDRAVGPGIERVHREVAPRGVLGDVARVGDDGAAAEGLDVAAEGGDLERPAARRPP